MEVHGVVISGVISRVTTHIRGLITPLITTHEPPSKGYARDPRAPFKGFRLEGFFGGFQV